MLTVKRQRFGLRHAPIWNSQVAPKHGNEKISEGKKINTHSSFYNELKNIILASMFKAMCHNQVQVTKCIQCNESQDLKTFQHMRCHVNQNIEVRTKSSILHIL